MSNQRKIIFVILLMILLGGVHYGTWKLFFQFRTEDATKWQTYRSKEYRFEIKYPKGWSVIASEDKIGFASLSEQAIREITKRGNKQEIANLENTAYYFGITIIEQEVDEWLDVQETMSKQLGLDFSNTKTVIGENEMYRIDAKTNEGKAGTSRVLFKKGKTYLIETLWPGECRAGEWIGKCQIFEKILSTFRFL